MRKQKLFKVLAFLMAAVLVLSFSACSSSVSKESASYKTESTITGAYTSDSYYDYGESIDAEFNKDDIVEDVSLEENLIERKIIKTAQMNIETQNFEETVSEIKNDVSSFGGYISSSSIRGNKSEGSRYSNLVLRIPQDKYESFMTNSESFGNVTYISEQEEDVTNEYIDLDARINNLSSQLKKLEELLTKAKTLDEMLTIEGYITDVQYQLDSMNGRMKALSNRISYCTVNININEVTVYTAPQDSFGARILSALEGMWSDFLNTLQDLFIFIIYLIPYLVLAAAIIVLIRLIKKKRRAKKAPQNKDDQEQNL